LRISISRRPSCMWRHLRSIWQATRRHLKTSFEVCGGIWGHAGGSGGMGSAASLKAKQCTTKYAPRFRIRHSSSLFVRRTATQGLLKASRSKVKKRHSHSFSDPAGLLQKFCSTKFTSKMLIFEIQHVGGTRAQRHWTRAFMFYRAQDWDE
jgi:hypothetical protein